MTTKTEKQYQHWSRVPARITGSCFSRVEEFEPRWSTRSSTGLIRGVPEEDAREYQVPLEAVLEALDYVAENRPLIEQERDHEAAGCVSAASSDLHWG